jgi:hypothetical protein
VPSSQVLIVADESSSQRMIRYRQEKRFLILVWQWAYPIWLSGLVLFCLFWLDVLKPEIPGLWLSGSLFLAGAIAEIWSRTRCEARLNQCPFCGRPMIATGLNRVMVDSIRYCESCGADVSALFYR